MSVFVVSKMNRETGIYSNDLVFTPIARFRYILERYEEHDIICIEEFDLGVTGPVKTLHSKEEFENETNI